MTINFFDYLEKHQNWENILNKIFEKICLFSEPVYIRKFFIKKHQICNI